MQLEKVRIGLTVRTVNKLGNARGIFVAPSHLKARKPDKEGLVTAYVPGHGGNVWLVWHDDDTVGAYTFEEFSPVLATKSRPHEARNGSEVLTSAKCRGLMQVIERIIARHHRGDCRLDEETFKLYEVAKSVYRAENNEQFLAAIDRL